MKNLKILIADDHYVVRMGLRLLTREMFTNPEIDESKDADEVMKNVRAKDYDLILLDLNMPKTNGVDLIGRIIRVKSTVRILVMSMNNESIYGTRVIEEGARGYISKACEFEKIREAISKVLSDGIYLSNQVILNLLGRKQTQTVSQNPFSALSSKEQEIAKLIYSGKTIKEIMSILNKSQSTISTQKASLFSKLGIENNSDFFEMAKLHDLNALDKRADFQTYLVHF